MILSIFLGLLIILFLLGFSVPYAIGLTSVVVMIVQRGFGGIQYGMIAQRLVYGVNSFTLLAIPFFLLAGKFMNTGSITRKIFDFCNIVIGWVPGGLGHANVLASIIFAGMSGSAVADASGLGVIEVRAMKDAGFDVDFAAAITAASSTIGPIIPPSIPLIVFGVAADASIAKLLMAGLIPGLVMGVALMIMVYYYAIKRHYPKTKFPTMKAVWDGFRGAFFPLLTPVILIGGILGGIFTATEAAAVAVVYAFVLTVIVYRELTLADIAKVMIDTALEASVILFIVGCSSLYGWLLVKTQMPTYFMNQLFQVSTNPYVILTLINLFLLVVGCFMETNAAIVILTPMMVPMALQLGINPIHLGIIVVLNLMIGLLTPPIGMCLYAVARVSEISFDRMVKAVLPFYIPLIVVLILVTAFPEVSLWFPRMVFGSV